MPTLTLTVMETPWLPAAACRRRRITVTAPVARSVTLRTSTSIEGKPASDAMLAVIVCCTGTVMLFAKRLPPAAGTMLKEKMSSSSAIGVTVGDGVDVIVGDGVLVDVAVSDGVVVDESEIDGVGDAE